MFTIALFYSFYSYHWRDLTVVYDSLIKLLFFDFVHCLKLKKKWRFRNQLCFRLRVTKQIRLPKRRFFKFLDHGKSQKNEVVLANDFILFELRTLIVKYSLAGSVTRNTYKTNAEMNRTGKCFETRWPRTGQIILWNPLTGLIKTAECGLLLENWV